MSVELLPSDEFIQRFAPDRRQNAARAGCAAGAAGIVIGFRVPSRDAVDQTYEDLTSAGYGGQQSPYDAFWGARFAVVEDPDGNSVGLMSPIDPAHRTAPPAPPA